MDGDFLFDDDDDDVGDQDNDRGHKIDSYSHNNQRKVIFSFKYILLLDLSRIGKKLGLKIYIS